MGRKMFYKTQSYCEIQNNEEFVKLAEPQTTLDLCSVIRSSALPHQVGKLAITPYHESYATSEKVGLVPQGG